MLWSEAPSPRGLLDRVRRGAAVTALALGTMALAGCGGSGFQPLYGTTASGRQMTEVLSHVDVSTIPGRVGQRIRNEEETLYPLYLPAY